MKQCNCDKIQNPEKKSIAELCQLRQSYFGCLKMSMTYQST